MLLLLALSLRLVGARANVLLRNKGPVPFDPSVHTLNRTIRSWSNFADWFSQDNYHPATNLLTPEVLELYGYSCETHQVQTEDGYILTLHRIAQGKGDKWVNSTYLHEDRPVVFLQHGLFATSFEWFMNTPDKLLALQLADDGNDVWLGNVRGNTYSRGHATKSPDDQDFWEFSFHEMGKYDLPASFDYILRLRKVDQLRYVGFSLGSTIFWVMTSLRPEFNAKVKVMVALAPAVYLNNMKGFPKKFVAPYEQDFKKIFDFTFGGEFLPPWLTNSYNSLVTKLASNSLLAEKICAKLICEMAGWNMPQMQLNQLPLFFGHTPSPTSSRTLAHFAQLINTGNFQQYDFGLDGNLDSYGTPFPPKYQITNSTVPVHLVWGQNDAIVDPIDVGRLSSELPNIISSHRVDFEFWNHFDYHLAKDANTLVNEHVLKILKNK